MTIRQSLQIRQGETWSFAFTWLDSAGSAIDLTGYMARMAVRDGYGGSLEAYLSDGSDADGGTIALGGALGTVTLSMTAVESAALGGNLSGFTLSETRGPVEQTIAYKYDCEVVSGAGVVTRILEGDLLVLREITTGT